MAREWNLAGHEVHVLTGPGDRGGEYAPDLGPAAEASGATVHRADCPGLARPAMQRPAYEGNTADLVAPRISRLKQILSQWKSFPDLQRSWIRPAAALGIDLHRRHHYDVVWSTSPPESVHFVGRELARAGVPWVPDFRDQWAEYLLARWDPASRWVIDRVTARLLSTAAAVTANTEGVAASIRRASGRDVVCVRNGWDPAPETHGTVRPRTLGYFGRVDPRFQHPERLWEPLRELRRRTRPWTVDLFAAPGGGGGSAIPVPPDLTPIARVHAPLPHPLALAEMQRMGALLVLGWETDGGDAAVAGKLFEYVGAGRPVLAVAPPHYEVHRLVESSGLGRGAWTPDELVLALQSLESFQVSREGRLALSRRKAAIDLAAVLATAAHLTQRQRQERN